ncbi:hypothetical protein EVJ58_g5918 [Rhodofomes roseus]|uniref:CFEM domain-containing protein n=1 Tax=Rhodofomes roseus TaxID=34475 RepID=A0A4Y9YCA6_9APHY|nr:hypothetical protein EVJ58_g5918 [Rhodofomes roseus]
MKAVLALFALVGAAAAQSSSAAVPTSTAGIDPCILSCVQSAASSAGCSSFTDLTCICSSSAFQTSALACLTANCPATDLAAAQALQSAECAAVSASSSASSATGSAASSALSSASSVLSSVSSAVSSASSAASRSSSASGSGSSSTHASTSGSASGTSGSASNTSSAGTRVDFAKGGLIGVMVALVGVAAGAGMVL